jgi:ubiquinone/menaquinone biosynthesis C-methylase UbiE
MGDYHLDELKIALDPANPGHILPPPLPAEAKVLDIGCGAGQSLIAAYPDRISFGIDVDIDALRLGSSLTDKVRFSGASADALPFRNAEFDLVFARVALPYTNIPASLREIQRVLKPNGRIWLVLHPLAIPLKQARMSNYKGKIYFVYVFLNGLALHLFQRQFSFRGKYESFQTDRGIRRALEQQGFADISISRGQHFVATARDVRRPPWAGLPG